jgi:type 1 fimbria pilin
MNKPLACLVVALLTVGNSMAFAASTVDLTVKGLIIPSACTPTLSSNTVDHGKVSAKDLNQAIQTRLNDARLSLNITCDAKTVFALKGTDNRAGSATDTTSYGLGLINGNQKLGNFWLVFANSVADTVNVEALESQDGGDTWEPLFDATPRVTSLVGFGDIAPIAIEQLDTEMTVSTAIAPANGLDLSDEVQIDGSATLEVNYL